MLKRSSDPLSFLSFNLSIRNLVIREAPNQLINQSRRHLCGEHFRTSVFKLRLSPGDGQSTPYSNLKGRGFTVSASGIHQFPVVRSPAIPECSRSSGKLGLREITSISKPAE
jgi:hypothetical protein